MLLSMHTMLAAMTKTPELILDPTEAKSMADAISRVARHYEIGASQKLLDHINLAMIIGMVYGTRFYTIYNQRNQPRETQAGVINFPIGGNA